MHVAGCFEGTKFTDIEDNAPALKMYSISHAMMATLVHPQNLIHKIF